MTDEEKEAINYFNECIKKDTIYEEILTIRYMKTVLSMLKEKDEEIEEYKKVQENKEKFYKKLSNDKEYYLKEIEKKDKMIDEMVKHIVNSAIVDDTIRVIKCDCETDIFEDCIYQKQPECTKQYFEKKAEEE